MTRFINLSTFETAPRTTLIAGIYRGIHPVHPRCAPDCIVVGLHAGDQPLDPLVDRPERILAQHGALSLIVELEVHPVDGEIATCGLGGADELAAQPRPGGLPRLIHRRVDLLVGGDPRRETFALQQIEDSAAALDVVVRQVELGDLRVGQFHVVAVLVTLEQLALDHPVDFGVDPTDRQPARSEGWTHGSADARRRARSTPAGCRPRWPDARRPAALAAGR